MAATTTTLESEILKRNTDCVYFLASPLTCKKGSECEYRHNDIARLNPRDCWYWLSGNCLNPTCAFRHPPLEGLTDASSSSVHMAHHSVVTASKTNVPCYFYFNAHCMKGDQCPFSHVMDDISHPQKFPKIAPEATATHLPVNKACTASDTGPAAVEIPSKLTDVTSNPKELTYETLGKNVDDTTLTNISNEPSPFHDSPGSSNHDYEEPMAKSPDNPSPEEKYMKARGDSFSEHSSDELVKDHTEPEEWWESSPGFDVLVDDVSEQLAYEDDADYLQVRERESERLHNHLMHYDYEDSAAYDPMDYPDDGFVYDQCPYDAYEHFSDGYAPDYAGGVLEPSGKRRLDSMLHRKRRSSHKEWVIEQHGIDLRDHLRKRRRMDVHLVSQDSQRFCPSHAKSTSQECPERHGAYHGRLSSELGRELGGNRIRLSHGEMESALDESHRMGNRLGYPYFGRRTVHSRNSELLGSLDDYNRRIKRLGHRDFGRPLVHSRRRENRGRRGRRERQHSMPKAIIPLDETRARQVPVTTFTGPKTLTQIRQERRKPHTREYGSNNLLRQQLRRAMSNEFEGPKPLSELLKDKKRFKSASDGRNDSVADYETTYQTARRVINGHLDEGTGTHYHCTADQLEGDFKSECLHIAEDEDEDDLARKVARILD